MAQAMSAERILSYFVTPADISREEQRRQSATVRRMAVAQIIGLVAIFTAQAIAYGTRLTADLISDENPLLTWAGLGILLLSCLAAILLANTRRPVEGAWLLVVMTTVFVGLMVGRESFASRTLWPFLSAVLFLWPIVVSGTMLVGNTVYVVAAVETILFLALALPYGLQPGNASPGEMNTLAPERFLLAFFLQYGVSVIVSFFFVAYLSRRSAASLLDAMHESELRAQEIMEANEALMEKSIQQVTLATQLGVSAVDLSTTSREQASGSAQQASAISEVTSTIEEMGYTARQIAQSSENVAQVADHTLEAVGRGQAAVDESVAAMEGIKGRVQELADKVLALGEHSQRIGEIMEIINSIADETHLLALNAAIESAGAGEHGRRFAVVASEVKNLANRALESSKEVRGIIAEIQRATNASVMAAEEGLKETERGVQQVYQAGRAMEEIVVLAQRNSEAGQEISLATTQQRSASEQIVETMREIADVANQTAEGSRQLADAATTLSAIADQLQTTGKIAGSVE